MDLITIIGLVASITNLTHACRSVIGTIKTFRNGDKDLAGLSHDLDLFVRALAGFDRLLRNRHSQQLLPPAVVDAMLDNSMDLVKDLGARLEKMSRSDYSAVRRAKWVQRKSDINKLQGQLREQKDMLHTFLSISHAETFFALADNQFVPKLSLSQPAVEGASRETAVDESPADESSLLLNAGRPNRARRYSTSSTATDQTLSSGAASSTRQLSISTAATSLSTSSRCGPPAPGPSSKEVASGNVADDASSFILAVENTRRRDLQLANPAMMVTRRSCRFDCHCQCHEEEHAKPNRRIRGFGNGKGKDTTSTACTDTSCRGNGALPKEPVDHTKSFRKALRDVMSSKTVQIKYELNTFRMVPEGSDAFRYVKHGNLDKLKECITSGEATVWDTAPDGWSLLHAGQRPILTAAYNRQLPIVKYLMELGVDTDVGDVGSRTPADLAVLKSIGQDATDIEHDIVQVFSRHDDVFADFEYTPIHKAVLELYDPTDKERPSLEALIHVADEANNAPASTNWSHWKAQYNGRSPLFVDILEYFRASAYEKPKGTKIIYNLLDQKDKKYAWTPLHWAASSGRADKMRTLVEHGADPFLLSNLDANILHAAAESKKNRGLIGALKIWKRCSDRLNINQINRWQETPLHVASWCSAACVKLLLEAGADPGIQEENGQIPLHCAGLSEASDDRRRIVSLLCGGQSNKHINTQDLSGRPPLFDLLDDADCVEILLRSGAKLDLEDDDGRNAFHHACMAGETETLVTMLRLCDNLEILTQKCDYGNTPLFEALAASNVECAMTLLEYDDIGDTVSKEGWAPVHYAARIGEPALLEAVCKHPSFMKGTQTMDGKRAEVVAMEAGNWHGKVKELLRQYDYLGWVD